MSFWEQTREFLSRMPIPLWLIFYERTHLAGDLLAGITVAVLFVPQGMAYALLAGMPPETGLYAGIVGSLVYSWGGRVPGISMGPTASLAILLATGVGAYAQAETPEYTQMALALTLMVAGIMLVMAIFHMGRLVNLMNPAVISAFASGAALVIALSQLENLLGIDVPQAATPIAMLANVVVRITDTHFITLGMGIVGILILLYFRYKLRPILRRLNLAETLVNVIARSGALVIILIGIVLVSLLNLDEQAGIEVLGTIPAGLPATTLPILDFNSFTLLFFTALTISLVAFTENVAITKAISDPNKSYAPRRELLVNSAANFFCSFSGGFVVNASFSRSAIGVETGAKTGLASLLTALVLIFVLLFLTPHLYYFPKVMLAAIVFVSTINLIDWSAPRRIWRKNRGNSVLWLLTFVMILLLGLAPGIILGLVAAVGIGILRKLGFSLPPRKRPEDNGQTAADPEI